jgi:hypothetical protein
VKAAGVRSEPSSAGELRAAALTVVPVLLGLALAATVAAGEASGPRCEGARPAAAWDAATGPPAIAAPALDQPGLRSDILGVVRGRLERSAGGRLDELDELDDPADAGLRLVVVSVGRRNATALVGRGEGQSLGAAIESAAEDLRGRVSPELLGQGRIKVDVAVSAGDVGRFDGEGRARLDRSLDGLWLPEPNLVLLPEELLSRRLVTTDGDLQSKRLRRYLEEQGPGAEPTIEGNPGRAGMPYATLRFDSFVEDEERRAVRLYRGNPLALEPSPERLLAAAVRAGDYLLLHQDEDGRFDYVYEPKWDAVGSGYNLVRHAGTCYALAELSDATGNRTYLNAARRGLEYLLTFSRAPKPEHAAAGFLAIVSSDEEAKLGTAALAVLAIVRCRQAGDGDALLEQARLLARFILFQQDADGRFRSKYFYGEPDPKPFESIYYPGEAILALARLHGVDPDSEWLAASRRGADWLIDVRDRGKGTDNLPHDHWLLMGLDELYATSGDPRYASHAERIAHAIITSQRLTDPHPDWIGSFYTPPRSTPTATRAEALVAMCRLGARTGGAIRPYLEALKRMASFQLRCQVSDESALYLPRPDRSLGGFRRSLTDWEIRIDYVQHNVSALLGTRTLLLGERSGIATHRSESQQP